MPVRQFLAVAWPAFLAACLLQGLVFAVVDPEELHWFRDSAGWSRQAVYAAGFFVFWVAAMVSSALAVLLAHPPPGE